MFLVTVIQTKEKKVTVMSAKPCSLPSNLLSTVKPQAPSAPKPSGPSFNNEFTQFLMSQSSKSAKALAETKDSADPEVPSPKVSPVKPTSTPVKVVVPPNKQSPQHVKVVVQPSKSLVLNITPGQLQQEAWTRNVLIQSQQSTTPSHQRVKTERIQPYVSGQNNIYTNQLQAENGKQLFCTIVSTSNNNSNVVSPQRQTQKQVSRQTIERKQQFF